MRLIIAFSSVIMFCSTVQAIEPKETTPYLFTPVELSEYQYFWAHPNNFELQESILAFPTAEGFGRNTTGGRGGEIIHVTNLNDNGLGSFRDAVERTGPRTVVFDVGGDIFLTGDQINIGTSFGDLTIAGETAPFPGITIRGDNIAATSFGGTINISGSNIIIRYISVRENNNNRTNNDCIRLRNDTGMSNVILDHVSMSNGADENFSTRGLTNGTVQNCMMTNADTTYNFLFGQSNYNFSFIGNYLSHTDQRNILVGYGTASESSEWINNVVYGYAEGMYIVYGNIADVIGNVYKAFPASPPNPVTIAWSPNGVNNPDGLSTDGAFYVENNYLLNPQGQLLYNFRANPDDPGYLGETSRVMTNSLITSWQTTRTAIEDRVLGNKLPGNSLHQDSMDAQAISDYATGAGTYSSLNVPNKTLVTRPASDDSDSDDMLDIAENYLWGNTTTSNSPLSFTNTSVVDKKGNSINQYNDHEKTLFYMAGDLGGTAVEPPPTTNTTSETTNLIIAH